MNLPPKKIYIKPYQVPGHYRIIKPRTYKFMCSFCDMESVRITYATKCPTYGNRCNGNKAKCLRKQTQRIQTEDDSASNKIFNPIIAKAEKAKKIVIDPGQLIEYINHLFLEKYNRKLSADLRYILIDLWNQKTYRQIGRLRKLKPTAVEQIVVNLLEQISAAISEVVVVNNFREIMEKHYLASEFLKQKQE